MADKRKLAREVREAIFEGDTISAEAFAGFCETLGHYRDALDEWNGQREGRAIALEFDLADRIVALSQALSSYPDRRQKAGSWAHGETQKLLTRCQRFLCPRWRQRS